MPLLKHVKSGDPFAPSARQTNAFIDAANDFMGRVVPAPPQKNTAYQTVITVKNVSGVTILPFQPLILGNLMVLPSVTDMPVGKFCFEANLPAQESDLSKRKLCIPLVPMDADEYGTAIITGLAVVRVEKVSDDHQYVEWKGTSDDTLQTASSGIARILHKSDSWFVSPTDSTPLMLLQLGTPAPASGGIYAYSGYFKLYLITETIGGVTGYGVRIADGATYQSETSVGGNSTCKVNGTPFSIAPYFSGALTANTLFYLKYNASTATVTLESSSTLTLPSDTDTTAYYQLGRFYTGTTPFVVQDHSNVGVIVGTSTIPSVVANGIPQIWWVKNEC